MKTQDTLDTILAPVKAMPPAEQLSFWRKFRATHRRRVAKTEAALCPDVFKAVDAQIEILKQRLARGV